MIDFFKTTLPKLFFNWKTFLLINLLMLIAKVIFSFYNHFEIGIFEDLTIAKNLATHHIYSWRLDFGSSAFKLPAYPLFLYSFIKVFGVDTAIKLIIIVQHFLYFFMPLILIRGFTNYRLTNAGFLSAYFFVLSPSYFYYSNVLEATNIFIPLFVGWCYIYSIMWIRKPKSVYVIILGILSGILALVQVVVIPIICALIILVLFYKKIDWKKTGMIFLFGTIVYSPWVMRNYITFDKLIFTKTPVWQNVYMGYTPDLQILSSNKFMTKKEEEKVFQEILKDNEFENELTYKREVEDIITKDQWAPFKKGFNNFISLWYVSKRYYDEDSLSIVVGRKLYVVVINLFLLLSFIFLLKYNYRVIVIIGIIIFGGFTCPYLIGHAGNIRFKLDFEWIQTSFIAFFIMETVKCYQKRKEKKVL
ncbi:hypothetical protein [Chryseobacterium sp.]|uniref:hypothetical protein n=1 Tax=Chryseobacterium sp. TaxID=1871047 RepID=UPI00289E06F1|nr:hypothetical protein [Chryseobacterium sp.]